MVTQTDMQTDILPGAGSTNTLVLFNLLFTFTYLFVSHAQRDTNNVQTKSQPYTNVLVNRQSAACELKFPIFYYRCVYDFLRLSVAW